MSSSRMLWTFAISSIALFMVTLDNLVVTTAIPVIRQDLDASLSSLEWTVNAYTLTFAVLLLTGAALGDRFGRRRVFAVGIGIFTLGSIAAALAPSVDTLNLARAFQGLGGAIVMPLTLTILSAAVPAEKRGLALGAWGGIAGLAVAFGPLVGGAIVQGIAWQWIFWLNVPIGVLLIPLALSRLKESYGPEGRLDLPGLGLVSAGLFGIVWGLVRGNSVGWASPQIVTALLVGLVLVAAFVAWELRTEAPMLPMRFFRNATFALANTASLFMYFGMFGSIFLLAQFFQTVQGYSPLGSGLRFLPWTLAPMFIAPLAGALSDKIPAKNMIGVGLAMQAGALAWMASVVDAHDALLAADRPLHRRRCRHGALLRAGGEPRSVGGAARGGGQVVRRQQRDPRAGRRVRRGGARLDLRPRRRLRHGPELRRRDEPGPLRRCRGRRARSARRVHDPAPATRNRGARGRAGAREPCRSSPTRQKPPDRPCRYATRTAPQGAVRRSQPGSPLIARSSRSSWTTSDCSCACVGSPRWTGLLGEFHGRRPRSTVLAARATPPL